MYNALEPLEGTTDVLRSKTLLAIVVQCFVLTVTGCGGGSSDNPTPMQPGQVRPADVLIPDEKMDFPTSPIRFTAVQGWAQVVTLSKTQQVAETAVLEMDFMRLLEEDPATGATTSIAEAGFDRDSPRLPCVLPIGVCEGALYQRDPWFGTDTHVEMFNSSVASGVLRIDVAPTPDKVAHWWTPRASSKQGRRYFIETRFRITGKAALQFGADYWLNLNADYNGPQDAKCEIHNNCQAWASIWFGDTGGGFVTKKVPLYK